MQLACNHGSAGGPEVALGGGAGQVHDHLKVPDQAAPDAGADRLAQQPPPLGALRRPGVLLGGSAMQSVQDLHVFHAHVCHVHVCHAHDARLKANQLHFKVASDTLCDAY